jgi:hypothetical protein
LTREPRPKTRAWQSKLQNKKRRQIETKIQQQRERERERKEDKKMGKCRLMRDNTSKTEKKEAAMGGDLVLCFLYLLLLFASSAAA